MASVYFQIALQQVLALKKILPYYFNLMAIAYFSFSPIIIQLSMQCQIKSKYRGVWQTTSISLNSQTEAFRFEREKNNKQIILRNIIRCYFVSLQNNDQRLMIQIQNRMYQIRGDIAKLKKIEDVYKFWTFFKNYQELTQQKLQIPKSIDYRARKIAAKITDQPTRIKHKQLSLIEKNEIIQYEQFYRPEDWKRDIQKGGLLFINEQKKSNQPKIIKYVISKFLSTGSFMGISFPVFAMKPQSILQTYCRCISLAPKLLTGVKNPIQRIKVFNCVIFTLSMRFTDLDKSFNPALGETYQGFVDGCQVFAEQISHHPPISAFTLIGKDFRLYGQLEVQASMSFNSARGKFFGDISVEYNDGGIIVGRLPCGVLSGYLFGRYVFLPDGACYCYDPINYIVCSYEHTQKDIMCGFIGKLNNKNWNQFYKLVSLSSEEVREQKYEYFQPIQQQKFEKVYSKMQVIWTKQVAYDGQVKIDYESEQWKPPKLSQKLPQNILPSDSRNRKDIHLRELNKIDESQQQKERIQQEERVFRKLRENYKQNQLHT